MKVINLKDLNFEKLAELRVEDGSGMVIYTKRELIICLSGCVYSNVKDDFPGSFSSSL